MKFLVTGGAGFIGSNFLHYMTDKYPEDYFVCLDALTYAGNYENIKELENNLKNRVREAQNRKVETNPREIKIK